MTKKIDWLSILIVCLLCITSICGILSLNFNHGYDVINQYGDTVKIYGSGIYASDSYFKAPISIGTDICILFVLVPLLIISIIKRIKNDSNINRLKLLTVYSVVLYYATSISFGVKYNRLHLVYILLFACSLFGMFSLLRKIDISSLKCYVSKGSKIFLVLSGFALIVAWMPDIIPTIISGNSLPLIEVYTTEITYILDLGIIAPLCFICLILFGKKDPIGILILASILELCIIVGIMMISQTVCQILSGIGLPLPVIITKSASFVILGGFAYYFQRKLYNGLGT